MWIHFIYIQYVLYSYLELMYWHVEKLYYILRDIHTKLL